MPKRPGPLKDFKKRKAKVGKKAVKQANVTKIDLRTKKIGLPTQRLGSNSTSTSSDSKPTSSKGVPLPDLLTQVHHYNAQSRVTALQGLKDLLSRHPVVASRELGTLLESACLELLQDAEGDVRGAMLGFANALLLSPNVDRPSLSPYAMLTCTYLSSALSSLDLAVQRDALGFLDVMVASFGALLLPHLPLLLASFPILLAKPPRPLKRKAPGSGAKPDATSVWHARLSVLRTLLGLIRLDPSTKAPGSLTSAATSRHTPSSDSSAGVLLLRGDEKLTDLQGHVTPGVMGLQVGQGDTQSMASVTAPLLPHLRNYLLEVIPSSPANQSASQATPGQQQQAKDTKGEAASGKKRKKGAVGTATGAATPMDVDVGAKAGGPGQGAKGGQSVEAAVLEPLGLTLDVAMEVLARCHVDGDGESAQGPTPSSTLLVSVGALFPLCLTEGSTAKDATSSGGVSLDTVNVALLEVLVESGTPSGRAKAYLLSLLRGPSMSSGQNDMTARLLRLLRTLLPRLQQEGGKSGAMAEELLRVFGPVVLKWPPSGAHTRQAVRLLCDLCPARPLPSALEWLRTATNLLPSWISPASTSGSASSVSNNGPSMARLVLETLLGLCKTTAAPQWLPDALLPLLQPSGASPAPLSLVPEVTRKRVLELVYHCPTLPQPLLDALGELLRTTGALDDENRGFVLEVLHHRRQLMTPSVYLTLLLSLLQPIDAPTTKTGTPPPPPRCHVTHTASLVSRSLVLLPAPMSTLLPLLLPPLTSLLTSPEPSQRLAAVSLLYHLLCPTVRGEDDAVPVTPLPEPLLQPLAEAIAQPVEDWEAEEGGSLGQYKLCLFRSALLVRYGRSLVDRTLSAVSGLQGEKPRPMPRRWWGRGARWRLPRC